MRGGKSFLILFVVAAAIGAYAYFVESKREVSDTSATPVVKPTKIWTLESDKIDEIDVKSTNGETTKLKKTGTTWQIVAPEQAEADQDAVSTIVSAIASLESSRTVDDNPPDVKPFELEPSRVSVTARVAGDPAPKTLELGGKTPAGSDLYARVQGQPKVFLVGSFLEEQLNRTLFDLRDKAVLKFDRATVDSVSIAAAGAPAIAAVKKSSEEWRLSSPVDARADFSIIDGVISQLSQARMKSIVAADGSQEAAKYGLDRPQATVVVGTGSSRATLAIGGTSPDGALFARDMTRPAVFTVETTLLDSVKKKPEDVRQKMLFEFRSYSAINIDITHGPEAFQFAKVIAAPPADASAAPTPDAWKQTKPAAKDIDLTRMTDFLVDVANLKAESFVSRAPATGDDYVVTVRFGEQNSPQEERATFRKSGAAVYAIQQGEPGAAVVPTADFDKAINGLKGLNAPAPPAAPTPPSPPAPKQ
jgi:hypothetical protein